MRLGRRHSCAITHWLKGITVNIWYCGSGKFATPTLPKALRNSGSWIYYLRWPSEVTGGYFFSLSLFRQKPLQPQACYSLSTLRCVALCVCWRGVSKMGWWGFDLQEWETHVTVALRVFVIGTACLVRLRGHSQLLGCSTEMEPDPIPTEQPWSHKQDASDVQLHKCGWPIPVQHKLFFINEFEAASAWNFPVLLSLPLVFFCFEYIEKDLSVKHLNKFSVIQPKHPK